MEVSLSEITFQLSSQFCSLLILGVAALLYLAGTWNYDYFSRQGIIADTPRIPFLGNSVKIFLGLETFPGYLMKLSKIGRGHSVMGIFEFQRPIFVIRSPEMMKIICVKSFDHFTNHRIFVNEETDPLFGKNLFNLQDQRWRDMRATLSPAFTTSKIKGMFPLISQCSLQMVDHLNTKYAADKANNTLGLETNLKDLFTRMANDVIATVAFGLHCDSLKEPNNEFYEKGKSLTSFSFKRIIIFLFLLTIPKIAKAMKVSFLDPGATSFFSSTIQEAVLERRRKNIFRPDMLQLLMQAKEGKLKAEKGDQNESEITGHKILELTEDDITAQAIIFFFAGFETVSTALCFTSYEISHHPEVQRRLQQEVDDVWERTGGNPTYEDVQGMKYLDAVISESLRLHPPLPGTERVCNEDIQLPALGLTPALTIRKGQYVSLPSMTLHYDEDFWPEPLHFDPERFNDENKHNIKPFTYMPFGLGPRMCIGQRFALVEVKLALAYLLRHFFLAPSPKTKHPMEYEKSANLTIKGGFWSFLTPRRQVD